MLRGLLCAQLVQGEENPLTAQDDFEEPAAEEAFTDAFEEEDEEEDGLRHRRLLRL